VQQLAALGVPWYYSGILLQRILDYVGYIITELHRLLVQLSPVWRGISLNLEPDFGSSSQIFLNPKLDLKRTGPKGETKQGHKRERGQRSGWSKLIRPACELKQSKGTRGEGGQGSGVKQDDKSYMWAKWSKLRLGVSTKALRVKQDNEGRIWVKTKQRCEQPGQGSGAKWDDESHIWVKWGKLRLPVVTSTRPWGWCKMMRAVYKLKQSKGASSLGRGVGWGKTISPMHELSGENQDWEQAQRPWGGALEQRDCWMVVKEAWCGGVKRKHGASMANGNGDQATALLCIQVPTQYM